MAGDTPVLLNYDLVPSPQLQSKLQRQFSDLERGLKFKAPFGESTKQVRDFSTELDRANQRVITLGASFAVLATSIRTLKEIVRSTVEVEKAFTEINAVFGLSSKGLDQFSKSLFNTARETSQSFEKAAEAAKEFSRQGLSSEETLKRTRDALILTRLANLDVASSVNTLTASINGFQKSALTSTAIVNKLATVDASFAVSSKDLAEGLARAGAAASDAGVSFDQLIGLITSAQQTTARGGAVIGNALKTIFTRIERTDTVEAMESLGVKVEDLQGNVLSALPLLQNFAKTYDTLGAAAKRSAAELVGGVYQINILKAVLGDLSKAQGIAAQATNVSSNATDEAVRRNEALNKSLDSMMQRLGVTGKQIGANIGQLSFAGPMKALIGAVESNPITKWLEDASGKAETTGGKIAQGLLKGVGGALVFGLGPLIAGALSKVVISTGRNVLKDFGDLTSIKTQSQEQAMIQSQIVSLYRAGGSALQNQLAAMSSLTEKAALLQRLLSTTNPNAAGQMAAAVYSIRGRTPPRAAGGYIPMGEESAAISAGIGGAPMGARPVYIPNFARGDGGRGIVANTSEFIAPMAGGSAIYNRDMIRRVGLPPGSMPVAAGGYIPHAAAGEWSSPDYYKWKPVPAAPPFGVAPGTPYTNSAPVPRSAAAGGQGFGQFINPIWEAESIWKQTWEKLTKQMAGTLLKSAATLNANAEIAGYGSLLQVGAPAPSAKRLTEMNKALALSRVRVVGAGSNRIGGPDSIIESRPWSGQPYTIPDDGLFSGGSPPPRPYGPKIPAWWKIRNWKQERATGAAERQAALNAATYHIENGAGFGSLTDQQRALYTNELRRSAAQKLGFDQTTAYFNRDARSQVNAAIAPQLAALRGRDMTLVPPMLEVGSGPSRLQRMMGFMGRHSQSANFAAAVGLPFAGGMISEGLGGTASGMMRGGLSTGLTSAGVGASVGMMIPVPGAALVGAGAGGLLGGAFGAVNKINKSFEELAVEIQEVTAKSAAQFNSAANVFRLQDDLKNAVENGASPSTIRDLRRSLKTENASISDPRLRKLITSGDPNAAGEAARLQSVDAIDNRTRTDLRSAVVGGFGETGLLSARTLGFGSGPSETSNNRRKDAIQRALGALSPSQRKALQSLAKVDPRSAIQTLGKISGLRGAELQDLYKQIDVGRAASIGVSAMLPLAALFGSGIGQAAFALGRLGERSSALSSSDLGASIVDSVSSFESDDATVATQKKREAFNRHVREMASDYSMRSRMSELYGDRAQRIASAGQNNILNSGGLTELQRMAKASEFEQGEISRSSEVKRTSTVFGGRSELIASQIRNGGITPSLLARIESASDVGGFQKLLDEGSGGNGDFKKVLLDLIEKLKELDATEDLQIDTSKALAAIMEKEYRDSRSPERSLARIRAATEMAPQRALDFAQNAREAYEVSIASNDPDSVRRRNQLESEVADMEAMRRQGLYGADGQRIVDTARMRGTSNLNYYERKDAFNASRGLGREFRINDRMRNDDLSLDEQMDDASISLSSALRRGDEEGSLSSLRLRKRDLGLESRFRNGGLSEGDLRLSRLRNRSTDARSSQFTSGSDIASADSALARELGLQGDSAGSALGGFRSVFSGIKRDMNDLSQLGANLAETLHTGFSTAWGDFVTGAKSAKDAVRSLFAGMASDASRMLGMKAIQSLFSMIPGFTPAGATGGEFTGRSFKFAAGGAVPAMLMGGEYVFGPQEAKRIGYDTLKQMNRYADGGPVRGGSGVRDDVPARLAPGSFVIRKSSAQRLGHDYLGAMANGQVQHKLLGGILLGGLLGGGIGYAFGGKKGAIGGALIGAIGGGLYAQHAAQAGQTITSAGGNITTIAGSAAKGLTMGQKALAGLGLSAGLGLVAQGMAGGDDSGPGAISLDQVPALRAQMEAKQNSDIGGRGAGKQVFLQINPQGGYSLAGYGDQIATRHWAKGGAVFHEPSIPTETRPGDMGGNGYSPLLSMRHFAAGGSVDMPSPPSLGIPRNGGGGACAVSVKIEINNNGSTSSSTQAEGGGPFGTDFASRIERVVRPIVQDELVRQYKDDGLFKQASRVT